MVPPRRPAGKWPSLKEQHARRCFHLGITEPAKVERLWETERARFEAQQAAAPKRRRHTKRA